MGVCRGCERPTSGSCSFSCGTASQLLRAAGEASLNYKAPIASLQRGHLSLRPARAPPGADAPAAAPGTWRACAGRRWFRGTRWAAARPAGEGVGWWGVVWAGWAVRAASRIRRTAACADRAGNERPDHDGVNQKPGRNEGKWFGTLTHLIDVGVGDAAVDIVPAVHLPHRRLNCGQHENMHSHHRRHANVDSFCL